MVDLNALPLPELYAELARTGLVTRLLELARDEDLGDARSPTRGDITSEAAVPPGERGEARVVCRREGVAAGLALVADALRLLGPACRFDPHARDGDELAPGATMGVVAGPLQEILAAERTLLNLVGRLSGVATLTRRYVEAIAREAPGAAARLFDTRKTTPGLRVLEKYAVRCGGGMCHRLALHDAVLIKDNHLAHVPGGELARRVAAAARAARAMRPAGALRFVEVEVDGLEQLARVLSVEPGLIDIVLLDNMPPERLREAVAMRDRAAARVELEASGGVTLETVGAIARTGVERISCGAITHSAPTVDVALDVE